MLKMGNCRLVAVTQPLILKNGTDDITAPGPMGYISVDEFLAYVARVSNPANQNNTLTASKLIKYLIKHKHFSPFEMVNVVMEINTTRDIARQILRHRSFSFQEFSQRYADVNSLGEFQFREARLQDNKNRQNSIETNDNELQHQWELQQTLVMNAAQKAYNLALELGIAKEQARAVLPEGLTPSRLYMNGSLRSWLHYCALRMSNGTQKEHQIIALECWEKIKTYFPSLADVDMENI
jgi:thymidylate synthase (FAD)